MACFTRPELKVERVSYDVITPSAARAVFEAIFWKPAFRWEITKIEVINPIKWTSIRRNEVGAVSNKPIFIEELIYIPVGMRKGETKNDIPHPDESPDKYFTIFERRASQGQCFTQPYLGTREFSAFFKLVNPASVNTVPIQESRDFGIMLYDMDFEGNPERPQAMFYRCRMENGIITVPEAKSKEVLR